MADYPVTPLTPPLSEQEIIRRQKLQGLIDAGQNPYEITRYDVTHHSQEVIDNFDALDGRYAGILQAIRESGKLDSETEAALCASLEETVSAFLAR